MRYKTRRRGRPKLSISAMDKGTPELQGKRRMTMTDEPLDICLKKGLISQNEHWAGLHLRWLYTVSMGSPSVSAYDPSYLGGKASHTYDEIWLKQREKEYDAALKLLRQLLCKSLLMNVCVFNQCPAFLKHSPITKNAAFSHEYKKFKEGLSHLYSVFVR